MPLSADLMHGSDERTVVLRGLVIAVLLTPFLLVLGPTRSVVSTNFLALSIVGGVFAGIVGSVVFDRIRLQNSDEVLVTMILFVIVIIATMLLWLLLPREHISSFLHFTITFLWILPLTNAVRYLASEPE